MKKLITLFIVISFYPLCTTAQLGFSFPSGTAGGGAGTALSTGWQAIDVNPSNLGWDDNKSFTAALLNFGLNVTANQLSIANIKKVANGDTSLLRPILTGNGVSIYANATWLALSLKLPIIGGLGFSISDRAYGNVVVSPNLDSKNGIGVAYAAVSNVILNAASASKSDGAVNVNQADSVGVLNSALSSFNGTSVNAYDYREVSFNYGREIIKFGASKDDPDYDFDSFKLYGGIAVNYLIGIADLSGSFNNNNTISANYSYINSRDALSLIPGDAPGHGMGVDIGTSLVWKKLKVALAATDLGSITWTGTNSFINDTTVINNIIRTVTDTNSSETANQKYIQTSNVKYKTMLPSKFRFGASYQIIDQITFAADVIIPLNDAPGNLLGPYFAVAAHLAPVKALGFDIGLAGSSGFGVNVPFGFSFGNRVQMYFGVTDVLSYLGAKSSGDFSAIIGLMRINL